MEAGSKGDDALIAAVYVGQYQDFALHFVPELCGTSSGGYIYQAREVEVR
jgi:hypothetical protein